MEKLKYYWTLADGIGFSPLIAIIGIAAYFFFRWGLNVDKAKAIVFVFLLNLLGQIRITKDILDNWEDVIYLAAGQAFIAFGIYSTLEVIKIIDVADAIKSGIISRIKKVFGGSDATPPTAPTA